MYVAFRLLISQQRNINTVVQIASKAQSVQGNWNENESEAEARMIENLFWGEWEDSGFLV